jgi:hypothetical protein
VPRGDQEPARRSGARTVSRYEAVAHRDSGRGAGKRLWSVRQDDDPAKVIQAPKKRWAASLVTTVKAGETVRWRSPQIGAVTRVALLANGSGMVYALKPRTNACVGYAYGEGVAVRVTDCVKGRRVPYVRVRAVNAGIKATRVTLRFGTR